MTLYARFMVIYPVFNCHPQQNAESTISPRGRNLARFDQKLCLEFGGKLLLDYHAAVYCPGSMLT